GGDRDPVDRGSGGAGGDGRGRAHQGGRVRMAARRRSYPRRVRAGAGPVIGLALSASAAVAGALAYGVFEPNAPLFGRAIGRGPRDGRRCYLTFDDGPNPSPTDPILDPPSARHAP